MTCGETFGYIPCYIPITRAELTRFQTNLFNNYIIVALFENRFPHSIHWVIHHLHYDLIAAIDEQPIMEYDINHSLGYSSSSPSIRLYLYLIHHRHIIATTGYYTLFIGCRIGLGFFGSGFGIFAGLKSWYHLLCKYLLQVGTI